MHLHFAADNDPAVGLTVQADCYWVLSESRPNKWSAPGKGKKSAGVGDRFLVFPGRCYFHRRLVQCFEVIQHAQCY